MEKFKVLVCDEDSSYIRALVRFLVTSRKQISVTAYSDPEGFACGGGTFDLALMGEAFLTIYSERSTEIFAKHVCYLTGKAGDRIGEYETFYKFQNMASLLDKIGTLQLRKKETDRYGIPTKTAIYSPIYHDLRLPFALTYAHIRASYEKVLFLDLENFSPLFDLVNFSSEEKDLYDILYLMESTEEEDFDITPYVFTYEGIGLLPSFRSPENIAGIREEQWEKLFACIERQGYSLVVLVEQLLQGSGELLSDFNDVILLGRTEDYFLPMQQRCLDLLNGMMQPPSIREVKLNMSANGLVEGTYSLKHLMEGNLGSFVRNEFKGTIASANP